MQKRFKVRLHEILSLELLQGAEPLAGKAGLDNVITSVNVMEVPDIVDWVRPGEFLLTTAYPFSQDIEAFNRLIPLLQEKGVCGMGIKTQRYIEKLPDSVLNTANRLNFPIIRIPHETSYGDLIKQILSYLLGEQTRILEQINKLNDKFREILLHKGDIEDFATQIALETHAPVVITDDLLKRYVFRCEDPRWKERLQNDLERLINSPEIQREIVLNEPRSQNDQLGSQNIRRYIIPIYFEAIQYGRIMIWDVNHNIEEKDISVFESVASFIALHSLSRLQLNERENVHRSNFIELLLSPNPEAQARALRDAPYFGFHPECYHQCLFLSLHQGDEVHLTPNNACLIKRMNTLFFNILQQLRKDFRYSFISACKGDNVVIVLEYEAGANETQRQQSLTHFMNQLRSGAQREKVADYTYLGAGNCYKGYAQLHRSMEEAEQVVRILQSKPKNDQHFVAYSELGLLRLFGEPALRESLLSFANDTLNPFLDPNTHKEGELLETIRAFFEYGGNLRRVSEALYTHYNTILYRINRIRDVFGVDLKDPDTAFNLQLALRIRDMLK